MKERIERYLPMVMGCHQRADRSFSCKGRPFVVCARCTGEIVGFLSGYFILFFVPTAWWMVPALLAPMIIDALVQAFTRYESRNWLRFATGFLGGLGVNMLLFLTAFYIAEQLFL